jgi:hypothetical protein
LKFKDLHTLELVAHYLRQSNACCIAGFGIFRLEKQSSHIDPIAQKFQPMELTPIFTQGNYETSTNFVSYCSSVWGLSFNEANQKIKLQLELSSQELLNKGLLFISELGQFSQGQNGIIQFEVAKETWSAASAFGLTGIRFIQETQQPKKILVDRTAKPGEHEDIEETRENALRELKQMLEDAGVDNNFETENNKPKSKVFPILATVLTLILLINVVLFLQKNPQAAKQTEIAKMDMAAALSDEIDSSIENKKTSELNPVNENLQTNNSPQIANNLLFNPGFAIIKNEFEFDSTSYFNQFDLLQLAKPEELKIKPEISNTYPVIEPKKGAVSNVEKAEDFASNSLEINPEKKQTLVNENAERLTHVQNEKSISYHLIVGAFGNLENAQKLQNEFNEKGFKEVQLIPAKKKGMTLVSLQTVSSEAEASDLKATLESQGIESWVFPKN